MPRGAGTGASLQLGLIGTLALGGLVCLGAAAVFLVRLPRLCPAARQRILAQQVAAGQPPGTATPSATESGRAG